MLKNFSLEVMGEAGKKWMAVLSLSALLLACGDKKVEKEASDKVVQKVQSPILVTVQGEAITEMDLQLAIHRTLGPKALFQADSKAQQKILESIVMSKALAIRTESLLSDEQRYEIERQTLAYRDELLAKKFLKEKISPKPVSEAMVAAYYEDNLDKFSTPAKLQVEFIQAGPNMTPSQRGPIMAALTRAQKESDWQTWVSSQDKQSLPLSYSQNAFSAKAMGSDIAQVIRGLKEGESSKVFFINKRPALARVIKRLPGTAKPLAQVSKEIRKTLAPMQLKKAIKASAADVMAEMKIEYKK